jgi:hypothetical protein
MKKLSGVVAIIIVAFGGWNFLHWAYQKALTTAKDPKIKVRAEDVKVRPFTLLSRSVEEPELFTANG